MNEISQFTKFLLCEETNFKETTGTNLNNVEYKKLNSPIAMKIQEKRELGKQFQQHLEGSDVAKKYYEDNSEYKRGYAKLASTGLEKDPAMCRFFSPDNMQDVEISKNGTQYTFLSKDQRTLGKCDVEKHILKVYTFEPDNYLNPLINQEYKKKSDGTWPDPDKNQTLLPNYTIDINNGKHMIKTDVLGRKYNQIDKLDLSSNSVRDNVAQVNSKELLNGYDKDQGGHTCAASLGGIRESINYTPMNSYVNEQGDIRKNEREATGYLKEGKSVVQETNFIYNNKDGVGGKYRPISYERILTVDGKTMDMVSIDNPYKDASGKSVSFGAAFNSDHYINEANYDHKQAKFHIQEAEYYTKQGKIDKVNQELKSAEEWSKKEEDEIKSSIEAKRKDNI